MELSFIYFEYISLSLLTFILIVVVTLLFFYLKTNTSSQFDFLVKQIDALQHIQTEQAGSIKLFLQQNLYEFKDALKKDAASQQQDFYKQQLDNLKLIQETIQTQMHDIRMQLVSSLTQQSEQLSKRVVELTEENNKRLKEISGQVEKRLSEGFEKTTATFADIVKRLALIDEAQKKITELSSNVVSLQEILVDKRSRGAFGEVQLSALIKNVIPEANCSFQHTLSNGKRVDCILFLPHPTGNVTIDAKFPLESFQRMTALNCSEAEKKIAEQQFRIDIKKHILDIANKYIINNETADGAIMFIPAEAIFAEIHGHYPDLVELAQKNRVWISSPTTMMAILTTARAVLKDAETRKQIHVIQHHLSALAKDFDRFQKRMDSLSKHIEQANQDVQEVQTSAKKISSRFEKIEKVELSSQVEEVDLL